MHESLQRKVLLKRNHTADCPFTSICPSYLISSSGNWMVMTACVTHRPRQAGHRAGCEDGTGPHMPGCVQVVLLRSLKLRINSLGQGTRRATLSFRVTGWTEEISSQKGWQVSGRKIRKCWDRRPSSVLVWTGQRSISVWQLFGAFAWGLTSYVNVGKLSLASLFSSWNQDKEMKKPM